MPQTNHRRGPFELDFSATQPAPAVNGAGTSPASVTPPAGTETVSSGRRSLAFSGLPHGRYFWHKWAHSDFVPPIYSFLDDEEWFLLQTWFKETEMLRIIGESTVPFMSWLQALVMGNRLRRIVQLGTYSGYSSLLMGFMLRRMGIKGGLLSSDIDQMTTDFANKYVRFAGLEE
ncbi:MAG TPA: hypothetical protein VFV81_01965, partial [Verrucomicrobiae bacterium]|nr:hypothetical protein [Verrucomicrobiae bacterium]